MLTDDSDIINQLRAEAPLLITAEVAVDSLPVTSIPLVYDNSSMVIVPEAAQKKEIIMADIVTGTITGQVDMTQTQMSLSDVRREQEAIGSSIRRETAKEASDVIDSVKTSAWANSDRTGSEADRVVAQDTAYFIAGQSQNFSNATALAALKAGTDANFNQTLSAIQLAAAQSTAASQLAGEKTAAAVALAGASAAAAAALGQAQIGTQIASDGATTRALINNLKMEALNRELIERNAALVELRGDSRHWQSNFANSQFAAVSNQVNALGSQLQDVKQNTVNFGTMSGSAGRVQTGGNNAA
jgi:hypothetical protein